MSRPSAKSAAWAESAIARGALPFAHPDHWWCGYGEPRYQHDPRDCGMFGPPPTTLDRLLDAQAGLARRCEHTGNDHGPEAFRAALDAVERLIPTVDPRQLEGNASPEMRAVLDALHDACVFANPDRARTAVEMLRGAR